MKKALILLPFLTLLSCSTTPISIKLGESKNLDSHIVVTYISSMSSDRYSIRYSVEYIASDKAGSGELYALDFTYQYYKDVIINGVSLEDLTGDDEFEDYKLPLKDYNYFLLVECFYTSYYNKKEIKAELNILAPWGGNNPYLIQIS